MYKFINNIQLHKGEEMSTFKTMPKSIKKAVRYIYQDAPVEHLKEIQNLVNQAINQRIKQEK
ncbi:hypothetical protein AS034_16310 [[Bacillus] enclensis]|nr:hypothetical protein AS034_16310 [[Bacillus] enclensis]